jgi:hypothetical protein
VTLFGVHRRGTGGHLHTRLALLVVSVSAALLGCPASIVASSHGSTGAGTSSGSGGGGGGGAGGSDLPAVHAICEDRIEYCSGGECPSERAATFGYDDGGRLVRYDEITPAGKALFALTREYDSAGRRVRQDEEDHEYGPLHRRVTWDYDGGDRVTSTTATSFASPGSTLETRFAYDDMGRPVRFETWTDGVLTEVTRILRIEGEPLILEQVRDTGLDGATELMARWTLAEGRWLIRFEQFHDGVVVAREDYTYADQSKGEVIGRDFDSNADGVADETDTILRDTSGRVQHFSITVGGVLELASDYVYDAEGRLSQHRWKATSSMGAAPFDATTTFVWSNGRLDRVVRGDTVTHSIWDSWTFVRGCSGDPSKNVMIAPVYSWSQELVTVPFEVDASTWWGFPEAL